MEKILKTILAVVILIIAAQSSLHSQWKPRTLNIAFVSESISVPFSQVIISPLHPGISIGTDLMIKDQTSWYRSFGVEASYYYHRTFEHAVMLDAVYNFGYTFSFGLRSTIIGAAGYKHSILTGSTFVLEDGEYVKKTHFGTPQANFRIGLGLEYPLSEKISVTTNYNGIMPVPGILGNPFSMHTLIKVGTKINF